MDTLSLVFCTFPNEEAAQKVSCELVSNRLAACVNILPSISSIYRWEGKVVSEKEVLAIFKIPSKSFEKLKVQLTKLHPYDVPEIVAITTDQVNEEYLKWVNGK